MAGKIDFGQSVWVFRRGAILLIATASFAQNLQPAPAALTADTIMARVAANQDRSEGLQNITKRLLTTAAFREAQ
jgi:hypothetical protein